MRITQLLLVLIVSASLLQGFGDGTGAGRSAPPPPRRAQPLAISYSTMPNGRVQT